MQNQVSVQMHRLLKKYSTAEHVACQQLLVYCTYSCVELVWQHIVTCNQQYVCGKAIWMRWHITLTNLVHLSFTVQKELSSSHKSLLIEVPATFVCCEFFLSIRYCSYDRLYASSVLSDYVCLCVSETFTVVLRRVLL